MNRRELVQQLVELAEQFVEFDHPKTAGDVWKLLDTGTPFVLWVWSPEGALFAKSSVIEDHATLLGRVFGISFEDQRMDETFFHGYWFSAHKLFVIYARYLGGKFRPATTSQERWVAQKLGVEPEYVLAVE